MSNTLLFALAFSIICGISSLPTASAADRGEDAEKARFAAITDADTMVMVPMRDGIRLATDVYLPKGKEGPFPVVFVRTPYDFNEINWPVREWAIEAVERGYAFVIQNERGRYYSEGEWEILGFPRTDGYDAMDWLAAQDWSSGKVATMGCSSSAEWQLALAAMDHPAHAAMVPMAAGAGIGRVGEFQEQGNWYKGGVHQTLFITWLYSVQQDLRPRFPDGLEQQALQRLRKMYDLDAQMPEVEWAKQLRTLPAVDWLRSAGGNAGPAEAFLRRTPGHADWFAGGLYHDDADFGVPALWLNSWFDVSQGPNLALFNHVRNKASDAAVRDGQYVLIAPTLHCGFYRTPQHDDLIVGDLNVGNASYPYWDLVFGFLDAYLKDGATGFEARTPRVQYYTMGRNQWSASEQWPPADAVMTPYYLTGGGAANSVFGDGALSSVPPANDPRMADRDSYTYDPMNPVPTHGGGFCCLGDAAEPGSFDQRGVEARADVLVYTSEVLSAPLEVTGFVRSKLYVSSDARDTDFSLKLVDVHPDGSAYNIDDTIFRARYREGYDRQVFMQPGKVYEVKPTPMSTSHEFQAGHRIRVEVSSSNFPQYNRNLNTGGDNVTETDGVVAINTIHHSAEYPSQVVLPVRPVPGAAP
jgi:putative CocE/NonD family hydrolase